MFLKVTSIIFVLFMGFGLNCFGQSVDVDINIGGSLRINGGSTPSQQQPQQSQVEKNGGFAVAGVEMYPHTFWIFSHGKTQGTKIGTKFINRNNYGIKIKVGYISFDLAPREERDNASLEFQVVKSSEIKVERQQNNNQTNSSSNSSGWDKFIRGEAEIHKY